MANLQKTFALILGIVLALVGILGLFLPGFQGNLLGFFGVNLWQTILHLVAGGFGIYVGTKGMGYGYNGAIGWIGVVLGILGFIPGIDALFMSLLYINTEITVLHLVIGIVSLLVYYTAEK